MINPATDLSPRAPACYGGMVEAELFRLGRLGMGWSAEALAQTVKVEKDIIVAWETGDAPIPAKVLSWVAMYARNLTLTQTPPAEDVEEDLAA